MPAATPASHSSAPLSATRLQTLKRLCRVQADAAAACTQRLTVSSGLPALDHLLPHGGLRLGSLVEWLEPPPETGVEAAAGAAAFALAVGVRLQANADLPPGRALVVIDRGGRLYPPAVVPWLEAASAPSSASSSAPSPPPSPARSAKVEQRASRQASQHASQLGHHRRVTPRLFVIRPASDADEIWAIDQTLRCAGVAAVVGWPGRVSATVFRRWQLAARSSGVVGLLVRPAAARHEPTWAETRIQVCPARAAALACSVRSPADKARWIERRACTLVRVGGQWDAATAVAEPTVTCVLDLTDGSECLAVTNGAGQVPEPVGWRGVACRVS